MVAGVGGISWEVLDKGGHLHSDLDPCLNALSPARKSSPVCIIRRIGPGWSNYMRIEKSIQPQNEITIYETEGRFVNDGILLVVHNRDIIPRT